MFNVLTLLSGHHFCSNVESSAGTPPTLVSLVPWLIGGNPPRFGFMVQKNPEPLLEIFHGKTYLTCKGDRKSLDLGPVGANQ